MSVVTAIFRTCLFLLLFAGTLDAQWVQTSGPFGGGTFNALAVSGTDIFAALSGDGVYRTVDNGTNWTRTGLTNNDVNTLAVFSAGGVSNVFAGTEGSGVFVSTDNGTTWTAVNLGLSSLDVRAFAVIDTNLFAGTYPGGVFLSTNKGKNWRQVSNNLPYRDVRALAVNGTNLFAGTVGGGVFLSTNNGVSWTVVSTGLTNKDIRALAVNGTNLVAGTYSAGVFLSTNNGASWTAVNNGLTNKNVRSLAVSNQNLFAGTLGGGVFLSADTGTSWIEVNNGLKIKNVFSFAVNGGNLFAGTNWGLFMSEDNGTSWTAASTSLPNSNVRTLAVGGTNVFAGTVGGGVYLMDGSDTNWVLTALSSGDVYALTASSAGSVTNVIAGLNPIGLFLSSNNGTTWTTSNSGFTDRINNFADNGTNLFAGTQGGGVFRSADNGRSWTQTGMTNRAIYGLAASGSNLFAANNRLYFSSDNGTSWAENYYFGTSVFALAVSGTNLFAAINTGVIRSSSNGINWTQPGLTNTRTNAFAVYGKNLFAGTDNGIFLSTNHGISWTQTGLANYEVNTLAVARNNLYAGTTGNGVWQRSLLEMLGPVVVLRPVGGEVFSVGSIDTIRWGTIGLANVRIEYSTNAGAIWSTIVSSTPASAGSYSWRVPNTTTTQGMVRISDADNAGRFDMNASFFTIRQTPSMTVTPNSFDVTLYEGEIVTRTITLGNAGLAPLTWYIHSKWSSHPLAIRFSSTFESVPPGGERNVTLIIDAATLSAGSLHTEIEITSNDPNHALIQIPIHLNVLGAPNITLASDTLRFVKTVVGYPDTVLLTIENTGSAILHVTGLTIDNHTAFYYLDNDVFDVPEQGSHIVPIVFEPANEGSFSGILTIRCDDMQDTLFPVRLVGNAVFPPLISLSSDSVTIPLQVRDTTIASVAIRNTGLGELHYQIVPPGDPRNLNIPLVIHDAIGNADTLYFGINPLATYCIDWSLGESYLPPVPSAPVFDVRFVDPRGYGDCFDQGFPVDLRPYIKAAQIDTYEVAIKPEGIAFPVTATWPVALDAYARTMTMTDRLGGFYVNSNMLTTTSLSLPNGNVRKLLIIKNGVPPADWCTVTSAGTGVVASGDSTIIQVTINTGLLEPRRYVISIVITTDDPLHPVVLLPVRVDVLSGVGEIADALPGSFRLYQNYPNPFNPTTTIHFDLPRESNVILKIFDVLGREVRTILNEKRIAGSYDVSVDGSGLPSGLYFYRIIAGEFVETKKMMVLK